jgi:hypothetical protein
MVGAIFRSVNMAFNENLTLSSLSDNKNGHQSAHAVAAFLLRIFLVNSLYESLMDNLILTAVAH